METTTDALLSYLSSHNFSHFVKLQARKWFNKEEHKVRQLMANTFFTLRSGGRNVRPDLCQSTDFTLNCYYSYVLVQYSVT